MIKEGPSISVDVSKSGVAYQGWLSYGKPHGKARKADMTRTGLSAIKALADDLGAKDGVAVPVAYEDTGIYSKPLRMFLSESGMVEAVMSPLLSAKVRKADDKPIKTDMRDCASIAEAYYGVPVRIRADADQFLRRDMLFYELETIDQFCTRFVTKKED